MDDENVKVDHEPNTFATVHFTRQKNPSFFQQYARMQGQTKIGHRHAMEIPWPKRDSKRVIFRHGNYFCCKEICFSFFLSFGTHLYIAMGAFFTRCVGNKMGFLCSTVLQIQYNVQQEEQ